jgi:NAD(P)-dependent dehydrogenase (short-subunit alcohol dehydrogenase family)
MFKKKRGWQMAEKNIFDLSGKIALITGGGSGIGRAYCEAMAEFGADVACNDIAEKKAQETVRLISKFGHRAIAIKADASKQDEIERMVNRTIEEFGKLDIVFCNAGLIIPPHRIHEVPIEDWDRLMALNLRGVFLLMQAALRVMVKQKSGCIINTASVAGLHAGGEGKSLTNVATYAAAKAGVILLTRHAAVEYGKDGIRVNAIAPGYHRTGLESTVPPEVRKEHEDIMVRNTPLRRVGMPEDLKGLAVWLASDASSFVTGQTIVQDGGLTL